MLLPDKLTVVANIYLGPAAGVFLERQTKRHMKGLDFHAIEPRHVQELAKWVNISAGLLIDKQKAQELSRQLVVISEEQEP